MTNSIPVSDIATVADLVNAYKSGQLSFVGLVLTETDLSGIDLKGGRPQLCRLLAAAI